MAGKKFVQGTKSAGDKGRRGYNKTSALNLVFKAIPRPLLVESFGIIWVGFGTEGCNWQNGGGGITNEKALAFDGVNV